MGGDRVRQRSNKLDVPTGPARTRPCVPRELAGGIARPLLTILERLWQRGEVSEDWRRAPVLRKGQGRGPGELWGSRPHLSPWAGDGVANPGNHFPWSMKVIKRRQRGFMNEKSSLTQPVAFCDEVAGSVAKGGQRVSPTLVSVRV